MRSTCGRRSHGLPRAPQAAPRLGEPIHGPNRGHAAAHRARRLPRAPACSYRMPLREFCRMDAVCSVEMHRAVREGAEKAREQPRGRGGYHTGRWCSGLACEGADVGPSASRREHGPSMSVRESILQNGREACRQGGALGWANRAIAGIRWVQPSAPACRLAQRSTQGGGGRPARPRCRILQNSLKQHSARGAADGRECAAPSCSGVLTNWVDRSRGSAR